MSTPVIHVLDLQSGLSRGSAGYSRWLPSVVAQGETARQRVQEVRGLLEQSPAQWVSTLASHPGFPHVKTRWQSTGAGTGIATMESGGETAAMLLLSAGNSGGAPAGEAVAVRQFTEVLVALGATGAEKLPEVLAGRVERPMIIKGNWIRGSATEAAVELMELWIALAFFEEPGGQQRA